MLNADFTTTFCKLQDHKFIILRSFTSIQIKEEKKNYKSSLSLLLMDYLIFTDILYGLRALSDKIY